MSALQKFTELKKEWILVLKAFGNTYFFIACNFLPAFGRLLVLPANVLTVLPLHCRQLHYHMCKPLTCRQQGQNGLGQ